MVHAARLCRFFPAVLLLVAGCAGRGPVPVPAAGASRYVCPDGRGFTTQFDPNTHQTDLWLNGDGLHRLDPVPDPIGGVLYQDAAYQLRSGATDAVRVFTDRSTIRRENCTRSTADGAAGRPPP